MNKIRIIDLLNKIANGEELPNKVKLKNYDYIFTLREDCTGYKWYGEEKTHDDFGEAIHKNLEFVLNHEIEIIEEDKKIEKLEYKYRNTYGNVSQHRKSEEPIINKINEIIDKLNELEEGKK